MYIINNIIYIFYLNEMNLFYLVFTTLVWKSFEKYKN